MNKTPPVLLIVFNRPDKVHKLMERIREAKPAQLFIAADGPRAHIQGEKEKCDKVRLIATTIDWPCEIKTLFQENNLGVDKGMETAMQWFFSNVDEGIICEDDCIPHNDFFTFSSALLEKYRNDPSISMICGSNLQGAPSGNDSYYFSRYPTWGYALWKRSWDSFDLTLSSFDSFIKEKKIDTILINNNEKKFWINFFKKIKKGKFNFMDTKILFGMWNVGGMCIIPQINLIKNIGFDEEATHTSIGKNITTVETSSLENIRHPIEIVVNHEADTRFFNKFHNKNILEKVVFKITLVYKTLIKHTP